jgi:NAD(P)-dependent dehydrogenase (short-subunit alcohol dehydrogenase family)
MVPAYRKPPFKPQQQPFPGQTDKMDPRPDHGEDSYVGHDLLAGKKTLITGGDSGIGAAVAIAFAREGADVAIAHLPGEEKDAERIAQLVKDAGREVITHACDISQPVQARALVEMVSEAFGRIDVLVNNAGYQRYFQTFEEITLEEWEKTFATNVHAPFNLVRLVLPHMGEGGAIINTASVQSKKPTPNILPYAATKAALANLTIGLAGLLAEKKIRVNAVLPGPIWTPFIPAGMDEKEVAEFGADTPYGRPGQPAELASAYVMLANDASSYTSGALVNVSGGSVVI